MFVRAIQISSHTRGGLDEGVFTELVRKANGDVSLQTRSQTAAAAKAAEAAEAEAASAPAPTSAPTRSRLPAPPALASKRKTRKNKKKALRLNASAAASATSSASETQQQAPPPPPPEPSNMKVAIAGTCGLARHIARAAIAEGHDIVLLSRHSRPDLHPLTVVRVDYTVPSSLHLALLGIDTVISTVTFTGPQLALIDACLTAHVRRFAPSEFSSSPDSRPITTTSTSYPTPSLDVLNRLREEKHRLDSTVFCCGLLYEWFAPGGLVGTGIRSSQAPHSGEGAFLLDFRAAKVPALPREEGRACFTAAGDVGRFVTKALGLRAWPEQLRCFGERLSLKELVRTCETFRGRRFEVTNTSIESLQDLAWDMEGEGEGEKSEMLLAVMRGEWEFEEANLNILFPEVRPRSFAEWLSEAWSNSKGK